MRKILRLLIPILALALCFQGCDTDSDEPTVTPPAGTAPEACDPVCADGESCVDSACVADEAPAACDPECADGESCVDGACVADEAPAACDPACADGESCVDGACVADDVPAACDPACAEGESCVDGACVEDAGAGGDDPQCQSFADVTVVFEDNGCMGCHTGTNSGGLDLSTYAGVTTGGSNGAAIADDDGAGSNLVTKLATATSPFGSVMPLGNPDSVSDEDIALLVEWIDGGAAETCE